MFPVFLFFQGLRSGKSLIILGFRIKRTCPKGTGIDQTGNSTILDGGFSILLQLERYCEGRMGFTRKTTSQGAKDEADKGNS